VATGPVAVCFRCEWSTLTGSIGDCPRCGVPLYVVRPPSSRPKRTVETKAVAPPPEPTTVRSGFRPWSVTVAVVALAVLIPAASFLTDPAPPTPRYDEGIADELRPVLVSSRTVEVPAGLAEVASEEADLVTFVAAQDTGGGGPLYRLWRMDLRSGSLIPGAVVASVRDLRLHPETEDTRLGFLAEGGALFSLSGFHASRPQWLAGGVEAFDFTGTRAPVAAQVQEVGPPGGDGTEIRVEVGRASGGRDRPTEPVEVQGLNLRGVRVWGSAAYLWGVRDGRGVLLLLRDGRLGERYLGRTRVLDVSPNGSLVLAVGDRSASVADPSGGLGRRLGLEISSVASWSPDGRWMAAVGSIAEGVEGLWLVDTRAGGLRQLDASAGADAPAGFSSSGRLALWTEAGAIAALDLATGNVSRVPLPPGFPVVVGPLVAG
jgi:hypothetical protein